jgi:hypothetical protein
MCKYWNITMGRSMYAFFPNWVILISATWPAYFPTDRTHAAEMRGAKSAKEVKMLKLIVRQNKNILCTVSKAVEWAKGWRVGAMS